MSKKSKKAPSLRPLTFQTGWDTSYKPLLRLVNGSVADEAARAMGLTFKESKSEHDDDGYHYFQYPRNAMSVEMIRRVGRKLGYAIKINLTDTQGADATDLLLPERPVTLQRRYVEHHGGKLFQVPPNVCTKAKKLIVKHPQFHILASASILIVFEDFDPQQKADKGGNFGGAVHGYAKKLGGAERDQTGFDFRITLCSSWWLDQTPVERERLLFHELKHCLCHPVSGKWVLRTGHDVEAFQDEIILYGDSPVNQSQVNAIKSAARLGKQLREGSSKKKGRRRGKKSKSKTTE